MLKGGLDSRSSKAVALSFLLAVVAARDGRSQSAPQRDVRDALGVNIHFVTPPPGEMQLLAASGVGWVRMDFDWAATEKAKGQYDFSAYDGLAAALEAAHLRALFILDYAHPLYDRGLSPASDEAREAFARWAAAAVAHFRGRGYLWEIYNEPNFRFWTPRPNRDDYIKLALAASEAIQEAAPGEQVIGPATAAVDPSFLEACFRAGLLNYWSAVSIHPYRPDDPESAANDLRQVRLLIRQYAPPGKEIPIVASEFGYSTAWRGMDEAKQARMLAREWLSDIANGVAVTIWYDWRDDGTDPANPEHHFGLVGIRPPATPPAEAGPGRLKPAYLAAQTLTRVLGDFHFNKQLALADGHDYVLLFNRGDSLRLAAWTTGAPHQAVIPASQGMFDATSFTGQALGPLKADRHGLQLSLTAEPVYLAPQRPNELLTLAANWTTLPLEIVVRAPGVLPLHLAVKNTLPKKTKFEVAARGAPYEAGPSVKAPPGGEATLELRVGAVARSVDPAALQVGLEAHGLPTLVQATNIVASNPLRVTVLPVSGDELPVSVANPSADAFDGVLAADGAEGLKFVWMIEPLHLASGVKETTVTLPLEGPPRQAYELGVAVVDTKFNRVLTVPRRRFLRVDDFSRMAPGSPPQDYGLIPEGGAAGSVEVAKLAPEPPSLAGASAQPPAAKPPSPPPPEGQAGAVRAPTPGLGALRVSFRLPGAEAALRLVPRQPDFIPIPGRPEAIGFWLWGDGSGVRPSVRFTDSTGQTFQEGGPLDWLGWRYVMVFLNRPIGRHNGGANDGVIHYPIRWDSLMMLEGSGQGETRGTMYLAGPTLIYEPDEKSR